MWEFLKDYYLTLGLTFAILFGFVLGIIRPHYDKLIIAMLSIIVMALYPFLFLILFLVGVVKLGTFFSSKR
jgi:hypothetical protein